MTEQELKDLSDKTLISLGEQGYSIWACDLFNGAKITIVRDDDKNLFNQQLRFSDPRRAAAQYPIFTVRELRELKKTSDWTWWMVREAKSLAPCWIELEGDREREGR